MVAGIGQHERADSELVLAARADDPQAYGLLFERWFDRCWNVARNIIRQDDLAAEIAQDAMLAGWQRLDQLDNPDAFGGWLLRITRNRALNRLEKERRSRAGGDDLVSALRDRNLDRGRPEPLGAQAQPSVEAMMEIQDQQELLWAAAAALGERDASLLDLHLRHGLTPAEMAEELGVEANTAHQQLFRLRNKLGDAIGSYLLWRNGRTLCAGLAAAVSGDVAFDRAVSRAVANHQKSCDECSERRRGLVSPGKLFASVPMVAVPLQLRVEAAAALAEAGVPVDPASVATGSGGNGGTDGSGHSGNAGGDAGHGGAGGTGSGNGSGAAGGTGQPALFPIVDVATGPVTPVAESTARDVAWSVARRTWTKSLVAVSAVFLVIVGLVAWSDSVSLGWLVPFTEDDGNALGSEVVAGPQTSEESQSADQAGGTGESPTGLVDPSSSEDAGGSIGLTSPTGVDDGSDSSPSPTETPPSTTSTTTSTTASSARTSTTSGTIGSTLSTTVATRPTTTETTRRSTTTEETTPTRPTRPDTSSTTTETTAPPRPLVIERFAALPLDNVLCNARGQRAFDAVWAVGNATEIVLTLADGRSMSVADKGTHRFCSVPAGSISLVARGPGGEDKAAAALG